jgi:thioredoxin reductase (NADPH)
MAEDLDLVVAGSGIAGLTAALTAARLGLRTLVLTGDMLGGQLLSINRIDGFPGFPEGIAGYDLCPMTQEQAQASGARIEATALAGIAAADGAWRVATAAGDQHVARAVILATGARLKTLCVPGEERLFGKGVSHCASCDAPLLRNRVLAVVGGGDSAAQEALTLAETATRVVILHRGAALTAQAAYRDPLLAHDKVELRLNTVVEEIVGDDHVTALRTHDAATGAAASLDSAAVFIYIGLQPMSAMVEGLVPLDKVGAIATDGMMRTQRRGLFAAGAVRSGWLGRAAAAAGEGATAAVAAHRYLGSEAWPNA